MINIIFDSCFFHLGHKFRTKSCLHRPNALNSSIIVTLERVWRKNIISPVTVYIAAILYAIKITTLISLWRRTDWHEKMLVEIILALVFIPTCLLGACPNTPCTSKEYQQQLQQGLNTHWFKTEDPTSTYNDKIIDDVKKKGFRNLRIRCNSKFFNGNYNSTKFRKFLETLEKVVDKCLKVMLVNEMYYDELK